MKKLILGFALIALVSGCGRNLFSKYAPDEFAVMSRAPLTLPPDVELRAPVAEEAHDRAQAHIRAKEALGASETKSKKITKTKGDEALLAKTGADKADPNIRQDVNAETEQLKTKGKISKIGEITGQSIAAEDESIKMDGGKIE